MNNNKYLASIKISIRQLLAQKSKMLGRLILYPTVIFLFYQVFQSVDQNPNRFWYLAITEWIILSTFPVAFRISEDIQSGQITYSLLRPMHYLWIRLCECAGISFVLFLELGALCLCIGFLLTHEIPGTLSSWLIGSVFAILGIILYTMIGILIGLFAFWFTEIQNLIYLNLTATFCFGGLIVPLEFYSESFRNFCFMTPYPWILWWPASFILGKSIALETAFLSFGIWMVLISTLIVFLYRKCMNAFVLEGG